MLSSEIKLRVRYAETDQMGFCYYGNYATYFEVARVEALRDMGLSYKKIEEQGIAMPVLEYSIKYFKPAFYDDELTIRTKTDIKGLRIYFKYDTFNQEGVHLNKASTTLVFVDKETLKPVSPPEIFTKKLS